MNSSICSAIRSRAEISFNYKNTTRTAEPHCHGTSRAGHEVVRAYQTSGGSRTGHSVGWKLFEVRHMRNISQTGATFVSARPGYDRNDDHIVTVHCYV